MICLAPLPDLDFLCPVCRIKLVVRDWYIPGMRSLADLYCSHCNREYFGDLPTGNALYQPMLIDKESGIVFDSNDTKYKWFADWLQDSFSERDTECIDYTIEEFHPLNDVVLLNCLDTLYGHCLLKLLNAQYYLDYHPNLSLVVIVPKLLRWMVPDGVAAIWSVDHPLSQGTEWSDCFAEELHNWAERFDNCWLSVAYPHPHPAYYSINRFTRIEPFPLNEWEDRTPSVTYIWREDRLWTNIKDKTLLSRVVHKVAIAKLIQKKRVLQLASRLSKVIPDIEFSIVGLGQPGDFPSWIKDLRKNDINEIVERSWCEQYASSHLVIGIHGSNMLLPSALAGSTVELMPVVKWGNMIQDLLVPDIDSRETLFRYRIVPVSISIPDLVNLISSLIRKFKTFQMKMSKEDTDHNIENLLHH